MSLPVAVEISEIRINVEGQRIETDNQRVEYQTQNNIFPICCCLFCTVILLYIILSVLKFLK